MAKKFDEMKEVISANSTPVKGAIGNATSALANFISEEDSGDGSSEMNPDGKLLSISYLCLIIIVPSTNKYPVGHWD